MIQPIVELSIQGDDYIVNIRDDDDDDEESETEEADPPIQLTDSILKYPSGGLVGVNADEAARDLNRYDMRKDFEPAPRVEIEDRKVGRLGPGRLVIDTIFGDDEDFWAKAESKFPHDAPFSIDGNPSKKSKCVSRVILIRGDDGVRKLLPGAGFTEFVVNTESGMGPKSKGPGKPGLCAVDNASIVQVGHAAHKADEGPGGGDFDSDVPGVKMRILENEFIQQLQWTVGMGSVYKKSS